MRNRPLQLSARRKKSLPGAASADIAAELEDLLSLDHIKPSLNWLIGQPAAAPSGDVPTGDVPSPQSAHPDIASPDKSSPDVSSPHAPPPSSTNLDITSPDLSSPDITSPVVPSPIARSGGPRKVHRCASVQDGHSATEQLVYDLMWRTARPLDPDTRLFQLPLEALAWKVKIAERNLRPLLQRLVQKRSLSKIAEPDRGHKIPAAYHVYSFRRVLALRKEAGLEYVVRSKGVEFVSREQAAALEAERAAARERLFSAADKISSPDDTSPLFFAPDPVSSITSPDPPSPLDGLSSPDVPVPTSPDATSSNTLLGHYSSGQSSAPAAVLPARLAAELRHLTGPAFTDAAAGRLWRECRRQASDCTVPEVLHFTRLKIDSLRSQPSVANLIGLILTTVPEFFAGGTLREYREQKSREAEQARLLAEENRRYYQHIVHDDNASPEDRAWALSMLQALNE